jgi:hypothetical protein
MGTGSPFPGGKARQGRDADHSPSSSAEVENEYELYILSPQAPPWRVARLLYFYFLNLLTGLLYILRRLAYDRLLKPLDICKTPCMSDQPFARCVTRPCHGSGG